MLGDFDLVTTLPVADLDRARNFYEQILGFDPVSEDAAGIRYRSGSSYFEIYPTLSGASAQHTLAAWPVDDLRREMAELRAKGVVFEEYDYPELKTDNGVAELPHEWSAWFKDSEGNILAVSQLKQDFRSK
ncbi:MAG TPA: VOC family protein [Actinomycetota bacterium]|nr:VOC family protein [Actinomycetota bacterium]